MTFYLSSVLFIQLFIINFIYSFANSPYSFCYSLCSLFSPPPGREAEGQGAICVVLAQCPQEQYSNFLYGGRGKGVTGGQGNTYFFSLIRPRRKAWSLQTPAFSGTRAALCSPTGAMTTHLHFSRVGGLWDSWLVEVVFITASKQLRLKRRDPVFASDLVVRGQLAVIIWPGRAVGMRIACRFSSKVVESKTKAAWSHPYPWEGHTGGFSVDLRPGYTVRPCLAQFPQYHLP